MATGHYWMPRIVLVVLVIQGSLEVKLPTIWTDEKQRWEGSEKRRRRKKIKKGKSPKKEDPGARKGRKVANTVFFQCFVAQEGRKVGSLKRRVRSQLARWEMNNCTPLWREAHFEVKIHKAHFFGPFLAVVMSKKCTPLWREAHFKVKMLKALHVPTIFGRSDVVSRGGRVAFPKKMAGVGHLKRIWQDAFSVAGAVQETRWFPEKGCILEHQIFSFGKMILRGRCSTSYDLASLFSGKRNTLKAWTGNIAKCIGTRPSALHWTFHFWRTSRKIVSFLMLSPLKIEEISQNCCVFKLAGRQADRQTNR